MPKIKQLDWDKLKPKVEDKIKYDKKKPLGYRKYPDKEANNGKNN